MTLLRRLAVLSFFLIAAMPHMAQAVSLLNSGTTPLAIYGLTFTVSGCQVGQNSGSGATHACGGSDGLQLLAVNTGRGTITFEVVGPSSGPALTETTIGNDVSNLSFTINAALTSGYTNAFKATSAALTTAGYEAFTSCTYCTGDQATASAALSGGPGTLTANLALQNQYTTQTLQTVSSATTNFTNPTNSFTITETLNLTNTDDTLGGLQFNYAKITLHTAPEPASITVLALGLSGLALARRRRRVSRVASIGEER